MTAYEAAGERFNAAMREWHEVQRAYRAQEIGDAEFLAGRAAHDAAQAEFDAADRAEVERCTIRLKLTKGERSALECAGLDEPTDVDEDFIAARWDGKNFLTFMSGDAEQLARVLTELANGEDGQAEEQGDAFARRACTALSNLCTKVRRAAADLPA